MKNKFNFRKAKYVICLALVCSFVSTKMTAQIPYRLFTDGCEWSVSNEKYITTGDTLIDGISYIKLYLQISNQPFEFNMSNAQYYTAIRNDTAGKKVYCNLPAGTKIYRDNMLIRQTESSQEFLLYDFSLALGDTVSYYTLYRDYYDGGVGGVIECKSVRSDHAYITSLSSGGNNHDDVCFYDDTIVGMSNGDSCRRIFLSGIQPLQVDDIWMEGIGSIMGFSNEFYFYSDMPSKRLLCFTNIEGASLHTGFDLDNSPEDCYNKSYFNAVPVRDFAYYAIFPNPANQTFTIGFTEVQESIKQVRIVDMLGKEVMSVENPSSNTVNIAHLPVGMYIVRVQSQSGKIYSAKLVKE